MRATALAIMTVLMFSTLACAQEKSTSKYLYILVANDMTIHGSANIQDKVTEFISSTPNPGDTVVVISGSTSSEILTYSIPDTINSDINSNLRLKYAQQGSWDTFVKAFSGNRTATASLFDLTRAINSTIPADGKKVPVVCFINMTKPLLEAGALDFTLQKSKHHLPNDSKFSLCTAAFNIVDIDERFNQSESTNATTLWSQYAKRLGSAEPKSTSSRTFSKTISKGNGGIARENCQDTTIPTPQPKSLSGGSVILSWDNPECDLDLYGKLGSEVLFYKHPETSFGKHYRQLKVGNELLLIGKADSIEIEIRHVNGPPPINAKIVAKDRDNNVITTRNITQFQSSASYRQPGNVLIIGSDSICKP